MEDFYKLYIEHIPQSQLLRIDMYVRKHNLSSKEGKEKHWVNFHHIHKHWCILKE